MKRVAKTLALALCGALSTFRASAADACSAPSPVYGAIATDASALPAERRFIAEALALRVRERQPTAGRALKVAYRLDPSLGGETARVTVKDGLAQVVAARPRALYYGMGRLLREMRWTQGGFSLKDGAWEVKPAKPVRVAYWARHFHNWYHTASAAELKRYAEDMLLVGVNCLNYQYFYPAVNVAGARPEEIARFERNAKQLYDHLKAMDMDYFAFGGGNQMPSDSPEEYRGVPETDWRRGNLGFNACPAKPKALKAMLDGRNKGLDRAEKDGVKPSWFLHWPFDEGGCECAKCRPWGGNGFIGLCRRLDEINKRRVPGCKTMLSTWTYHDDDYAGLWEYLKKPESAWIDGLMIDDHEDFPKWPLTHGIPRNLPVITFPEISMWRRWPWGGTGAIAMPARFERLFRQAEKVASGFMFYSEGLSEDVNKFVVAGLYVDPTRHWQELVRDYARQWLPGLDADRFVELVSLMEATQANPIWERIYRNYPDAKAAALLPTAIKLRDLARALEPGLLPSQRTAWRWRLIRLRAEIEALLWTPGGPRTEALRRCFCEVNEIYHAEPNPGDYNDGTHCSVRAPLAQAAPRTGSVAPKMRVGKPGAVKPAGWLRDQALAARNGFTGHMDEVDEHFRLAWTTNCMRRGAHLNWIDSHKGSWSAEGGAYWFDGLVKLAFQLDDAELKAMAGRRLDAVLDNVGPNTVGFLWWYDRRKGGDVSDAFNNGSWRFWTVGMSERVLSAWWAATGDTRVPRALKDVFGFADMAQRFGGGMPTLLSGVYDAAQVTRSPQVEDCLAISCTNYYKNIYAKPPWRGLVDTLGIKREHTGHYNMPSRHGVGASESLLSTLRAYLWTGDEKFLKAVLDWYAFFDRHCRQPYGVTMMDEEWGWAGAKRGTETCDVAAEMFTRENLLAALGDGKWGDDVERAFFNAGPACVSRDYKRHVYFQMPNRTGAAGESGKMSCPWDSHLRYGLSVWPLCCTAALNRILPNYVQHMWLKTAEGGVAAALYGPSTFEADLPVGRVKFVEETAYPFAETIAIRVASAPAKAFPLKLRLPGWCANPEVSVNGAVQKLAAARGFATLNRVWKRGDVVALRFGMTPRIEAFHDMNEQGRLRRSVVLGPLLFAYAIPTADDNTPSAPVREPLLSAALKPADLAVRRGAMPAVWNWPEASPLKVVAPDAEGRALELVPYGCTKLRISAFGTEQADAVR